MRTRSGRTNQGSHGARTEATAAQVNNGAPNPISVPVTSTSITPPYVTSIAHAALVKWNRERQEYGKGFLRSVKNSFNRLLLTTLCKIEWVTTVEDVTDERIIEGLDKIVGTVMNDAILNVDAIFNDELKMDLRERDVKTHVINCFMRCGEIILQHGMATIFSTKAGVKEKCKILRKHLERAALREAVHTHLRLLDGKLKSNERSLYSLVKDKALGQEKVYQLLAKRKHQHNDCRATTSAKQGNNNASRQDSNRTHTDRKAHRVPGILALRLRRHQLLHRSRLLRHEASQGLAVFNAAKTTGSASAQIWTRPKRINFWSNEKQNDQPAMTKQKCVDAPSTEDRTNRPIVVINDGVLDIPYCADSGSDMNISRKHVDLLCEQDVTVVLVELDAPIISRTVGGAMLTSTHAIKARQTLNTAAGLVRCQDTKR
ncbi:hypothetical protein PHMEG_00010551 [Phytophthora megakarya]|uniref:Uncharacterized protein n=1 Tax=Phytophthora megakarya TaxID=4795 RepID=A0A225WF53_9STRA|nr:hypothetical protein PHMEG_00010551 [Phytophthora megakarya]